MSILGSFPHLREKFYCLYMLKIKDVNNSDLKKYRHSIFKLSLVFKQCFWDGKGLHCDLLTFFSGDQVLPFCFILLSFDSLRNYIHLTIYLACPSLAIPNGQIDSTSTTCGTVLHLTCDKGYTLVGDGNIVCEPSGQWQNDSSCQINGIKV